MVKKVKKVVRTQEEKREYWNDKIKMELEYVNFKNSLKQGLMSPNTKVEGYVWSIPSINIVKLFNDYIKKEGATSEECKRLHDFTKYNGICTNCSECKQYCYNQKFYFCQNNFSSRLLRLLAFLNNRQQLAYNINKELSKPLSDVVRLHVEGDFFSNDYLTFWLDIIKKNPKIKFYCYTKNFKLFKEFLEGGKKLPKNLYINISLNSEILGNVSLINEIKAIQALTSVNFFIAYNESNKHLIEDSLKLFELKRIKHCSGKCILCKSCYKSSYNNLITCRIH